MAYANPLTYLKTNPIYSISENDMITLRMGTRGSKLAIAQAESVARKLAERVSGITVETVIIETSGDINRNAPLYAMKTPGTFTREIEKALFEHRIDFAVHSLKDLPAFLPEGLALAPPPPAEDARECIIGEMRPGAIIGCGSPRRRFALSVISGALLHSAGHGVQADCREAQADRPDMQEPLAFADIRGNIPTRLEKLRSGQYGTIVMAYAALKRLGLENLGLRPEDAHVLDAEDMLPAPCQGILGLEYRAGDEKVRKVLSAISDSDAHLRAQAERAFLQALHLGCNTPASCLAQRQGLLVNVRASLAAVPAAGNASSAAGTEADAAQAASAEANGARAVCASANDCADQASSAAGATRATGAAQTASAAPNAAIMLETEIAMPCELAEEAGKLAAQTLMSVCQAHNLMPATEPPCHTIPMQKISLSPPRPLAGKTAVILRSPDEAEPFIKALETLGAQALAYPVIRCEPLEISEMPQDLLAEFAENPQNFQAIVFASRRSPELALKALGSKTRELLAFCTGNSTAAEALKCGFAKERIVVPEHHDSEGILDALRGYFHFTGSTSEPGTITEAQAANASPGETAASEAHAATACSCGTVHTCSSGTASPRIIVTMPEGIGKLAHAAEKAGFQVARLPLYRTRPLKETTAFVPETPALVPEVPALVPEAPELATAASGQAPQPPALEQHAASAAILAAAVPPDLIMAFSPSALESFFRLSALSPSATTIAAIGKTTAERAEQLGCSNIAVSPLPEPQHFLKTAFIYLVNHK